MKDNIVKHDWGYEIVWARKPEYVSKIIVLEKAGAKTDMVFHKSGKKSFFVNEGAFKIRWIDTTNGLLNEQQLRMGDVYDVQEMQPYSLESIYPNSSLTEVNNGISEQDRFVIISQKTFAQGEENVQPINQS